MTGDPFGTAALRDRVLAEWTASPDRFREDANAEEDLSLGGYRDRLVVELAQNAADAAARAGRPGRLLLRLATTDTGPLLVAANTGSPLDAPGVRGLATLRASAKRDDDPLATVGRFGVGFAAVLAVTDEPAVVSHGRGVRFSRADTAAVVRRAAEDAPGLAAELERRDGHVPVLRLPFATDGTAPTGYDTAVLLPLRDGSAADLTERLLDEVGDPLLLALPGLAEVVVELPGRPPRRVADVASRWHGVRREGVHPPQVLADRPTEERQRPAWAVTWALPRRRADAVPAVPPVLHAPTPTDEPLPWPALLIATFPLDSSRRAVAPGPATDALLAQAAHAYADLLRELAQAGEDVLALVPTGLPAGAVDARLREAVLAALPAVRMLPAVEDGALLRPRDAVALDGTAGENERALQALAPVVAGLVAAPRAGRAALAALGVRRLDLADVVEQLPPDPDPAVWVPRYRGLAALADDQGAREALAAIPVPLADGRVVRGARGTTLPAVASDADRLAPLAAYGLRVVHPQAVADPAASRLLERLGARTAGPRELLDDPRVRVAVEAAAELADGQGAEETGEDHAGSDGDGGVAAVAAAVLSLVRAAVRTGELLPGQLPWLAELPLPADDGEVLPAGAMVLPGSPAAALLDPREVVEVSPALVADWGADVLEAVGVARTLPLVTAADVDPVDLPEELDDLDGAREWAATLPVGTAPEVVALRDLDLVADDAWPRALAQVAADRLLRQAVTVPVVVRAPDGSARTAAPYAAWWLRRRLSLARSADPDADPALAALLPEAPRWLADVDATLRCALGLPRTWADLDDDGWAVVLAALVEQDPEPDVVLRTWRAVARAAQSDRPPDLRPPDLLRVPAGPGSRVVPTSRVAVVDAPMWLQRPDVGPLLPVPAGAAEAVADLLDVDLASERAPGTVAAGGSPQPVPAAVAALLPGAPARWQEHDDLVVDGVHVDWWVSGAGASADVHAATLAGLARGLAQAAGGWDARLAVEAVLVDPAAAPDVLLEEALGS